MFIEYLGRAKASAGELRAQTYVALDTGYLNAAQFEQVFDPSDKCSRQISRFMAYFEAQPDTKRVRDEGEEYDVEVLERGTVSVKSLPEDGE